MSTSTPGFPKIFDQDFHRPFYIDIKSIREFKKEKLIDYVFAYEKHLKNLHSECEIQKIEKQKMFEKCSGLENQINVLTIANLSLGTKDMDFEIINDSINSLKFSVSSFLESFGEEKSCSSVAILNTFHQKVDLFLKEATEKVNNHISSELLISIQSDLKSILQNCSTNLEESIKNLSEELRKIFIKVCKNDEPHLLQKFPVSDLLIVSKAKLTANSKIFAILKKDLLVQENSNRFQQKRLEDLNQEKVLLISKSKHLETAFNEIKEQFDTYREKVSSNQHENNGHLEVLKLLQQENNSLNMMSHDLQQIGTKREELILSLKSQLKAANEQITSLNSHLVSANRQESMRNSQANQSIIQLKEEIRKLELILKTETRKYEIMYHDFEEFKKNHFRQIQALSESHRKSVTSQTRTMEVIPDEKTSKTLHFLNKSEEQHKQSFKFDRKNKDWENKSSDSNLEIEELRLKLITAEIQTTMERRAFDEMTAEKNVEIEKVKSEVGFLNANVEMLQKFSKSAREEIVKLNKVIEVYQLNERQAEVYEQGVRKTAELVTEGNEGMTKQQQLSKFRGILKFFNKKIAGKDEVDI